MNLTSYKIKTPQKKFDHRFQALADEMSAYFKRNCYWLFYHHELWKIENAYKVCKEKGITNQNYLLGILKRP